MSWHVWPVASSRRSCRHWNLMKCLRVWTETHSHARTRPACVPSDIFPTVSQNLCGRLGLVRHVCSLVAHTLLLWQRHRCWHWTTLHCRPSRGGTLSTATWPVPERWRPRQVCPTWENFTSPGTVYGYHTGYQARSNFNFIDIHQVEQYTRVD